jgi:hypothetical protein
MKALLPLSISAALASRQRIRAFIGALLFCCFSGWSFVSEIGLYSLSRDAAAAHANGTRAAYENIKTERSKITARLAAIGQTRPSKTIEADIQAQRQSRWWEVTNGCKEATGTASRQYCAAIDGLQGQLAAAQEAEKLMSQDHELATKMAGFDLREVLKSADAQSAALSRFTGFSPESIRDALAVAIAVLVELGSAFGLYVVSVGGGRREEEAQRPAATKPRAPEKRKPKDAVRSFVRAMLLTKPGMETTAAQIYLAWQAWAVENKVEQSLRRSWAAASGSLAIPLRGEAGSLDGAVYSCGSLLKLDCGSLAKGLTLFTLALIEGGHPSRKEE